MNTLDGAVSSMCDDRHPPPGMVEISPRDRPSHTEQSGNPLIADNYATYKHPKAQKWLARHPRFHIYYTPTSNSWLNMVERFFRDLTQTWARTSH
jgi:hypothetical protein